MSTPDEGIGASPQEQGAGAPGSQPTEEELRAAYEAELSRITTGDMILQSAASLLNIGGLRLGLGSGRDSSTEVERDLEQVRDAIDGVKALLPIVERRGPRQLGPLRDALAQLQMAYAREAQGSAADAVKEGPASPTAPASPPKSEDSSGPGPAQASGRLWVPGR